jgi:hypothetical protein
MEPECSLPYSQEPATGTCPEPDESIHTTQPCFPKHYINIIIPSTSSLLSGAFYPGSAMNILYEIFISSMRATCPAHITLLYFIILIIFKKITNLKLLIFQFSPASCHFVPNVYNLIWPFLGNLRVL